ncbi:peptidylprolyl isomerase [Sabulilitoribacter arenilitoris]|uniref:Peptidylprolyl isomerase n=1 Tax=Wocania arenilitoris TaxID=2044858 RepID=A0AAE3EPD8_9FLAO|nr:peptidylprolyl isomerase [Wocania arenilitoris]MCF7567799.1 peptidylprolyl isomerase [Wocania arenilitoris]
MKLKCFFTLLLTAIVFFVNAQSDAKEVLFTVDNEPVYVSEFLRVYNKNLDLVQDESQKDVDKYLSLFTTYKLKLKEAKALELDKKPSYLRELNTYKKQLAKNFIYDNKVTDELVKEAYERISYDIKANHILIRLPENASPQDTLVAFNKISKLRDRALSEGFETVRKEVHNGKSVFGEELGYFSGFRMVYRFENAAFNTNVGDISQPFRTRFGYHIVKVLDKRKSRGERAVAHIMLAIRENDTVNEKPETRIQDIYKKLNQGEEFEALAKQFSDDKNSAPKGGKLAAFSSGQLSSPEFEEVAFSLERVGDVSEPFKTKYGWHIVKLHDKKLTPEFEDIKSELEAKVKRDERSKIIDKALTDKLRVKYNVKDNPEALSYFASILNDDYYKKTWKLPADFKGDTPLVKIGKQQFSFINFGAYLEKNQRGVNPKSTFKNMVSEKYNTFLNARLINYQENHLEEENEEFANIVNEYRDGLLLFDLMETTIWNTAKTDSVEIRNYYNANKEKYVLPKRIDAVVASSAKQRTLKKVANLLEQNMSLEDIKKLVNNNGEVNVVFTSSTMDANHQALPDNFQFTKGISKIYKHNKAFIVAKVNEVLPKQLKTFEEAKGLIISDFQTHKEENWIKKLEEKYKVVINQNVLDKVKNQIKS